MECPKLFTHNKEEQKWMQKVKKAMNSLSTKTWLLTPVSQRDLMRNVYTVFIARASFAEAEEWFATVWSCGLRWCILMCLFVAVCFFDPCCTIAVWHVCVVCCDFVRIVRDAKCGYVNNRTTRIQYKSTERWRLFCATVRMISLVVTKPL